MLHAARWKYRRQKWCKKSPSAHHRTTLSGYIPWQLRHISTTGKNLLSSNISPACPYNKVNFGPLAAKIVSLVWRTPANFNGFRVLSALLHGTLLVGASQTVALNRGRHLHLAGRPSRWALAHISSFVYEIPQEPLNGFVPNSQGETCLVLRSDELNIKVKNQRSRSPRTKMGFSADISGIADRWTDLRQIHMEDVFGPLLLRFWMSRSKVKGQGHQV